MAFGAGDADRHGNYILDHWRGTLPLGQSYWINGGLIGSVVGIQIPIVIHSLMTDETSLRISSTAAIAMVAVGLLLWIWGAVGIWRSSARHQARGGDPTWAAIARTMVLAGAVGIAFHGPATTMFLAEITRLAAGKDSIGQPVTIRVVGDDAHLSGYLALGSADNVKKALEKAPNVTTMFLESNGGRVGEAAQINAFIRSRNMDTVAEGPCLSACTIVFVGGKERSLMPHGKLGFHQPSFPGVGPEQLTVMGRIQREALSRAGVLDSFIDQSFQATPEQMWVPTEDQLFAAGVLNATTKMRVIEDNRLAARQIALTLPKRLDSITTQTSVDAIGPSLISHMRVDMDRNKINIQVMHDHLVSRVSARLCGIPDAYRSIQAGAIYVQDFTDRKGLLITTVSVSHCKRPDVDMRYGR